MIVLYIILALIVLLLLALAAGTIRHKPKPEAEREASPLPLNADAMARNLSGMLQFKTITATTMDGFDRSAFLGLHAYMEKTYPLLHKTLEKEIVNEFSLLYRWPGTDPKAKPFLLMGHMDVVPVEESTQGQWAHPAFSGEIAEGYVWGRGAIDMKGQVACILESVEYLLGKGFTPKQDIYLAFGHDEEAMGTFGAEKLVERLQQKGVHFEFVLDEGGVVMNGSMLNIDSMVATIGTCEKGYVDVRLIAKSAGGHASRPPRHTAAGDLARAIAAIEAHPMKPFLNRPLNDMLNSVCGYMKFPLNVIASNLWITRPLLLKALGSGSTGSAMVRTTMAPTMLKGSSAPNVLAERAEAIVNLRIAPGQTVEDAIQHIRKVTGGKITVEPILANEPSGVSSVDTRAYKVIADTIRGIFTGYIVAPYLMIGATDSRKYAPVADNIYRFQPFCSMTEDLDTIHAVGERLAISSLTQGTEFFIKLIQNA